MRASRRATLSDFLHAKAALTPEMVLRIEKAFGPRMEQLLRMQLAYDVAEARQHAREHVGIGVSGYKIDEVDGFDVWLWPDHASFPSGTPAPGCAMRWRTPCWPSRRASGWSPPAPSSRSA